MPHHSSSEGLSLRSDAYLLERALGGDPACFGELATRWQKKLYGFIFRHVGNADEARDLTQETLTKAFQNLSSLADPSRFSAWLYKIALNECRMRNRKRSRIQPVVFEDYVESPDSPSHSETPEKVFSDHQVGSLLERAFRDLPEEQQSVIIMKEYQGLKFHEIAEILDIPLSTVKSRMYLGLKTMRRLLENKL